MVSHKNPLRNQPEFSILFIAAQDRQDVVLFAHCHPSSIR